MRTSRWVFRFLRDTRPVLTWEQKRPTACHREQNENVLANGMRTRCNYDVGATSCYNARYAQSVADGHVFLTDTCFPETPDQRVSPKVRSSIFNFHWIIIGYSYHCSAS